MRVFCNFSTRLDDCESAVLIGDRWPHFLSIFLPRWDISQTKKNVRVNMFLWRVINEPLRVLQTWRNCFWRVHYGRSVHQKYSRTFANAAFKRVRGAEVRVRFNTDACWQVNFYNYIVWGRRVSTSISHKVVNIFIVRLILINLVPTL